MVNRGIDALLIAFHQLIVSRQLTPAGAEALSLAERAQEAIEDDVLRALDPSERATLWELLTRALYGSEPAANEAYSATTASIST